MERQKRESENQLDGTAGGKNFPVGWWIHFHIRSIFLLIVTHLQQTLVMWPHVWGIPVETLLSHNRLTSSLVTRTTSGSQTSYCQSLTGLACVSAAAAAETLSCRPVWWATPPSSAPSLPWCATATASSTVSETTGERDLPGGSWRLFTLYNGVLRGSGGEPNLALLKLGLFPLLWHQDRRLDHSVEILPRHWCRVAVQQLLQFPARDAPPGHHIPTVAWWNSKTWASGWDITSMWNLSVRCRQPGVVT